MKKKTVKKKAVKKKVSRKKKTVKRKETLPAMDEVFFQNLVDSTPVGITVIDQKGIIRFVNEQMHTWFRKNKEDPVGKMFFRITKHFTKGSLIDMVKKFRKGIKEHKAPPPFEVTGILKDGSENPFIIYSIPFYSGRKLKGVQTVFVDIAERKRAEERFRLISHVSTDLIYEWDVKTDSLEWFGDIDKALGYKQGEIPRMIKGWVGLIHPDDLKKMKGAVSFHRKSTKPIHYVYRIRKKDGTWAYWEDKALPVLDKKGKPVMWVGGCKDITERKRAEEELKESEAKLRNLMGSTPISIQGYDADGKVNY